MSIKSTIRQPGSINATVNADSKVVPVSVTLANVSSSQVGLGNVTNESKATMFDNPVFTGAITGTLATAAQPNITSVGALSSLDVTGDLRVTGNFQVDGTTNTINITNLNVTDNIIGLNNGLTVANTKDSGLIIERGTSGDNAAFIWDESEDRFVLGTTTLDATASGNISLTNRSDLELSAIKVTNGSTNELNVGFIGSGGDVYTNSTANAAYIQILNNNHFEIAAGNPSQRIFKLSDSGYATFKSGAVFGSNLSIPNKIQHTGDSDTFISFPAANTFTIQTGGSERLRVNSSGEVGIGTTDPTRDLEVNGRVLIERDDQTASNLDVTGPVRVTHDLFKDSGKTNKFADNSNHFHDITRINRITQQGTGDILNIERVQEKYYAIESNLLKNNKAAFWNWHRVTRSVNTTSVSLTNLTGWDVSGIQDSSNRQATSQALFPAGGAEATTFTFSSGNNPFSLDALLRITIDIDFEGAIVAASLFAKVTGISGDEATVVLYGGNYKSTDEVPDGNSQTAVTENFSVREIDTSQYMPLASGTGIDVLSDSTRAITTDTFSLSFASAHGLELNDVITVLTDATGGFKEAESAYVKEVTSTTEAKFVYGRLLEPAGNLALSDLSASSVVGILKGSLDGLHRETAGDILFQFNSDNVGRYKSYQIGPGTEVGADCIAIGKNVYNKDASTIKIGYDNNMLNIGSTGIDVAGSVGIGTTTPNRALHIKTITTDDDGQHPLRVEGASSSIIEINAGNDTSFSGIDFGDTTIESGNVSSHPGSIIYNHSNDSMIFDTNNATRMTIDSSGDITMTSDLTVNQITGTLQTAAQPNITSVGNLTSLSVDTNTLFVDSTNNRVGIGTASPGTPLAVIGASTLNGTVKIPTVNASLTKQNCYNKTGGIRLQKAAATTDEITMRYEGANSDNFVIEQYKNNALKGQIKFVAAGSQNALRLTTSSGGIVELGRARALQNLDIGNSGSNIKLTIKDSRTASHGLHFDHTGVSSTVQMGMRGSHGDVKQGNFIITHTQSGSTDDVIEIANGGQSVSINKLTYFNNDLQINEKIRHTGNSGTDFGFPTVNQFAVRTNNVTRLNVISTGEVGIGKAPTAGGAKLDVSGNIAATDITASGNVAITGNLTVSGDATTVNTTHLNVADNIISLNDGLTTANVNDSGIIIERGTTGDNAAILWDESEDKFVLGTTTATDSNAGNITVTEGNLKINDLEASGNISLGGNIVDTDTNEIITIGTNDITFTGKHIKSGFGVGIRGNRGDTKGIDNSSTSANLGIYCNSIEAITVKNDGKVGIMTPLPAYSLDLNESSGDNTIRLVSKNNGTAIRIGAGGHSNDVTLLRVDGETDNNQGNSDSSKFGFSMRYIGSGSGNANAFRIEADNQSATTRVTALTILQDGKVGIGTTTASEALEVAGNISFDGDLHISSDGYISWNGGTDNVISVEERFLLQPDGNTALSWSNSGVNMSNLTVTNMLQTTGDVEMDGCEFGISGGSAEFGGQVTFNEAVEFQDEVDFSSGGLIGLTDLAVDTNLLAVDGTLNKVGIGHTPTSSSAKFTVDAETIKFEMSGDVGLDISNSLFTYKIGDISEAETGTYLELDSTNGFTQLHGSGLGIGKAPASGIELDVNGDIAASGTVTSTSTTARPVQNNETDSAPIRNIRNMTQSAYDALSSKDANTLYIIVG